MLSQLLQTFAQQFRTRYSDIHTLVSTATTFHASETSTMLSKELKPLPAFDGNTLLFGKYSSDHMATIPYSVQKGWGKPIISPFQNLSIHPFSSALHYGVQCFYGLKAYKNAKGYIRLFRPECNAIRLKKSSVRLTLPDFDGEYFVKVIEQLVKVYERWIPPMNYFSLYIRPLHISMEESLGVKSPEKSQLMILAGPVGPYYPSGFNPISLSCATETVRSSHKGTGSFKIGGNYSPTLITSKSVIAKGHQQVLWLLGDQVIEVGASNIFFVFKEKNGTIEIATPALEDLILPGVTRDSLLTLLEHQKEYKISERTITMTEVVDRHKKGELIECFGAGTAVIVSPVKNIEYLGKDYPIFIDYKIKAGPISAKIRRQILDIHEGRAYDIFGWVRRVR